jgi:hypothetical protein
VAISEIIDILLVTLRDAGDIRIIGPDGAVSCSAGQFGWDGRVDNLTFFLLCGTEGVPLLQDWRGVRSLLQNVDEPLSEIVKGVGIGQGIA